MKNKSLNDIPLLFSEGFSISYDPNTFAPLFVCFRMHDADKKKVEFGMPISEFIFLSGIFLNELSKKKSSLDEITKGDVS